MRILGVVDWTDRDKRDSPIAGVRPLFEVQKKDWRAVDAKEEFPSQGQVFWPNAQMAIDGGLLMFDPAPNPGQKDEFKVVSPKPALDVLDLSRLGSPEAVRAALVEGVRWPGPVGPVRALVLCKQDTLIGPVDMTRVATGTARLSGANLARIPSYSDFTLRPVAVAAGIQRLVRVDEGAASGHVDWDDDATVLRRALEIAVRIAKQGGHDTGQTKRQIEEAARALSAQVGIDAQLDRYRLERAVAVCHDVGNLSPSVAAEIVDQLRHHPMIQNQLDALTAQRRSEVEAETRARLANDLARERSSLQATVDAITHRKAELVTSESELSRLKEELVAIAQRTRDATHAVEAAIGDRVREVLEKPLDLLADVAVLRPFLGGGQSVGRGETPVRNHPSRVGFALKRGEGVKDAAALKRAMVAAARARGVEPSQMAQIHAAIAAGLMPAALGPSGLASIAAYAHAACGGRMAILHVSPATLHPRDLDSDPEGGLAAAQAAAKDVEGMSLLVLEGANRAPMEASILPLLELASLAPAPEATRFRLAATIVAGPTTVPVTPQIWSHSVAIYPAPVPPMPPSTAVGDLALDSDLLAPGDVPSEQIDELLDAWPECGELRPALQRFGAALTRVVDGERITASLREGLILPFLVTALSVEEQEAAVAKAGDADGDTATALLRLRRRLC